MKVADESMAIEVNDGCIPRKIKVCFLIDNLNRAGTENHLIGLINNLNRVRFHVVLVLLDGENAASRQLEPAGCEVLRLGVRSFFALSTFRKAVEFQRFLRRSRIDIVQTYFPDSSLFGTVVGKFAGVPHIIRTRRNMGYWITPVHRIRGFIVSKLANLSIANSEASRITLIEQECAPANSVVIIPNGVNLRQFRGEKDRSRCPSRIARRIGMLANLRPVKRVDVFIRAAAKLLSERNDLSFEIAGEGPLQEELQNLIDDLGVSQRVKLLGTMDDVAKYLGRLDVLVTCSESEGLSNTLLEAMATGLPVVASDIDANRTLIQNLVNGILSPVGDATALAERICQILNDGQLANRLGTAAYAFVAEHFDQERMIENYERLYLSLANAKPVSPMSSVGC